MIGMNYSELDIPWVKTTWVRCWDIQCDSARIMAGGPGSYDWSRLDRWFDKAESIGAKTVYVAWGCPEWQAKGKGEHNAPWMPPKANSEWKSLDVWNEFIHNLVTRYKGRLHAIEIGNEAANLKDFFEGAGTKAGAKTLAQMHKRAYKTIKALDPSITVVANSVLPRKSSGGMKRAQYFLDAMKEKGWPCDAVSCHIYPLPDKPDAHGGGANYPEFKRDYDAVKSAVKKAGGPYKKNWVTEWNIDLLKPQLADNKAQNIIRKIREKHKGFVFFYAYSRPDLGGIFVGPNTLAWSEMEKMV
jgi:GH35 family endo-1,4-beta-xylanase